jgi:hypothetical protein
MNLRQLPNVSEANSAVATFRNPHKSPLTRRIAASLLALRVPSIQPGKEGPDRTYSLAALFIRE